MNSNRTWKFFRAGGFDQVKLESGSDLMALDQLDQKLWVALACPTTGLHFDARTLALIDTDKDGRVRAPELITAVKWAGSLLKTPDLLVKSPDALPLNAINDSTPEGQQILASARQILTNLGKSEAVSISVEDTVDTAKIFAQTAFNGDGIIVDDSASDAATKAVLKDIITCYGADVDRSGKPGVSQAKADQFFADLTAYSEWWKKAEGDKTILPAGEATPNAGVAVRTIKPKLDDFFARCRLAAFDTRAVAALNREEKEYLALAAKDLTISSAEIASLPLARIEAGRALPLGDGVNPAWSGALNAFATTAVKPLLGQKNTLSEADWATLQGKLAAFDAWNASKVGAAVEPLGLKRVREILSSKAKENISALLAKDKAEEGNANSIAAVEKLVRYCRDLYLLCTNFVNFKDFYDRGEPAIFQAGTLYLDQRSCDLCLPVEDAGKHALMAGLAGTYLAYCDCFRKATGEKMQIVAAFTGGDSDNLMVGRNGIFYDRKRRDWDATITKIIDNPISIRQAFFAPYKKLVRLIEEQIAKRAASADAAVTAKMQTTAQGVATADQQKPEPPKKIDTGTLAAIGLVLTTLMGAIGTVFARILGLPWWEIPLAFIGIILAISIPSMIIAYLKLRKRNLGPILDANGWAVNARARINVPFGASLTQVAALPPGSQRDLADPFAEKHKPWALYIILLIILGLAISWWLGKLDRILPGPARSTTVLGTNAPAYVPPGTITNAVPVVPVERK